MPLIKDLTRAIDLNDRDFYKDCTDDERASFPLWTYQRYCSSLQTHPGHALIMTNELVNVNFQDLQKDHPELVWMCMSLTGVGRVGFHSWIKPPKGRAKKDKITDWLRDIYPTTRDEDIGMLRTLNTDAELIEHAKALGYDDEKIKEIFNTGKKRRKPRRQRL